MGSDVVHLAIPAYDIAFRTVIVYLALLLGFRIFGKREIGQFTIFDLILVLLVANGLQPAMTGPDSSLVGGMIIIVVLLGANWLVGWLRLHSPFAPLFRELVESHPTVIAENGQWLPAAMRREQVDPEDAVMALREHGLESVEQAKLVVLETDGTISVVPKSSDLYRGRRSVRFLRQRP